MPRAMWTERRAGYVLKYDVRAATNVREIMKTNRAKSSVDGNDEMKDIALDLT